MNNRLVESNRPEEKKRELMKLITVNNAGLRKHVTVEIHKIIINVFSTFDDLMENLKNYFTKEDISEFSLHITDADSSINITSFKNMKISEISYTIKYLRNENVEVNVSVLNKLKQIHITDITGYVNDNENTMYIKWKPDLNYKRMLRLLKIDMNPKNWYVSDVYVWLKYTSSKLKITGVNYDILKDNVLGGKRLLTIPGNLFKSIVPNDTNNVLWTHLQVLKKYGWVPEMVSNSHTVNETKNELCKPDFSRPSSKKSPSLARFVFDLLNNEDHKDIIHWIDTNQRTFTFSNSKVVIILWAFIKNKTPGNFRRFSFELRSTCISKIDKHHIWKFKEFDKLPGVTLDEKLGTY